MDREQIRAWVATRRQPILTQTFHEIIALHHIDDLLAAIDELTAKSVVIDATVAAFAGDKSAVVRSLQARIDELTAENKELKLDLAAAEHYTTDDAASPARLCVKCRCPWPCEFTSVPAQGYGRTGGGPGAVMDRSHVRPVKEATNA